VTDDFGNAEELCWWEGDRYSVLSTCSGLTLICLLDSGSLEVTSAYSDWTQHRKAHAAWLVICRVDQTWMAQAMKQSNASRVTFTISGPQRESKFRLVCGGSKSLEEHGLWKSLCNSACSDLRIHGTSSPVDVLSCPLV
jgi:hypothetical protein